MKTKITILSAALMLAMAGSANAAGVKDWIKNKTQALKPQTTEQAPSSELAECDAFWKGVSNGTIKASAQNQAKGERCQTLMTSTPAASKDTAPASTASAAPGTKTLETVEVKGERSTQPKADMREVMEKGAMGCGIGAVLGSLVGVDGSVACAAGGLITGAFSYRKQIKQAREVEAAAKAAGMTAAVSTEQVVDGKGTKREALSSLVIAYDPQDMEALDAKTVAVLDKLAAMLSKSSNTLTIRFEGMAGCDTAVAELTKRDALSRHTVNNQCGKSTTAAITVTPIPDVR